MIQISPFSLKLHPSSGSKIEARVFGHWYPIILTFHSGLVIGVLWGSQVFDCKRRLNFCSPWFCGIFFAGMSQAVEFSEFSACRRYLSVCDSVSQSSSKIVSTYVLLLLSFLCRTLTKGGKSSFSTDMVKYWLLTAQEDWPSHSPQDLLGCYQEVGGPPCYSVCIRFPPDLCWGLCGNHSWFCFSCRCLKGLSPARPAAVNLFLEDGRSS